MKKLTVLSGAGISAESGISTFRDAGGLWEGHDIMEVASPQGWDQNPSLVLDFYNKRRKELLKVSPNSAHIDLVGLEQQFKVDIVTQNVDDLHERAGSTSVLHLHGELLKVRSINDPEHIVEWKKELNLGDLCPNRSQLRPHIVWFGEMVPMLEPAIKIVEKADIVLVIGTSLQVYPAASLISYASQSAEIFYIDPHPFISHELKIRKHTVINAVATEGMKQLRESHLK